MYKALRWALASFILIAVVVFIEYQIGWYSVLSAWQNVSPSLLLLLVVLTFFSYYLRAYRVFLYFGKPEQHPLPTYVRINFIHNAFNNFLPMRLGEASFPIMMKKEFEVPLLKSGAGLLWIRLMDLHWLLVLLCLVALSQLGSWVGIFLAGLIAGPFILFYLSNAKFIRKIKFANKILEKLAQYSPESWSFAIKLYLLTAVVWIIKLAALTVVMLSFIDIPGFQGLLAVISADLSSVLPIHGLAGSGTFEAAMLAALVPLGVDSDAVLLAAINVHLYVLIVTLLSVPVAFLMPRR